MTSKQHIYAQILQRGILSIRSRSADAAFCHAVADFLHNIPLNMLEEGFTDLDFYFLNVEISSYVSYSRHLNIAADQTLLTLAEELRALVPEELQSKIKPSTSPPSP